MYFVSSFVDASKFFRFQRAVRWPSSRTSHDLCTGTSCSIQRWRPQPLYLHFHSNALHLVGAKHILPVWSGKHPTSSSSCGRAWIQFGDEWHLLGSGVRLDAPQTAVRRNHTTIGYYSFLGCRIALHMHRRALIVHLMVSLCRLRNTVDYTIVH